MNIQLILGEFNAQDTLDLLTQMIHIKIKYHENKILNNSSEEDIKSRESKIIRLQKELFELREIIKSKNKNFKIDGTIKIE
jgi:hypothetical protein